MDAVNEPTQFTLIKNPLAAIGLNPTYTTSEQVEYAIQSMT